MELLDNPIFLYDKACWHLEHISNSAESPEYEYHIFDCAVSLNHLFDWYLKSDTFLDESKTKCVHKFNPYRSIEKTNKKFKKYYPANFPTTNISQEIVRQISNKIKNLEKYPAFEDDSKRYNCSAGSDNMSCNNPGAVAGAYKGYTYRVRTKKEEHLITEVLASLCKQWSNFLNESV